MGRQELGKEHSTAAGEMILSVLYGKVHNAISAWAVLHTSSQGTLLEPMDRVIWSPSTSPLDMTHSTEIWPPFCSPSSQRTNDWFSWSCQLLLCCLAHPHLLLLHRIALKTSHKEGFSDDVWSSLSRTESREQLWLTGYFKLDVGARGCWIRKKGARKQPQTRTMSSAVLYANIRSREAIFTFLLEARWKPVQHLT